MKATYDTRTDRLSIVLRPGVLVAESYEDEPGVILDDDQRGDRASIEFQGTPTRVGEPRRVEIVSTG